MNYKILYIFVFLFSLTILPYCKSSSPDDTTQTGDQAKDENTETPQLDLEAPKMSDLPALLKMDPPMPLLQDILPAIPNNLNDSTIILVRLQYRCEDKKEKEGVNPDLYFTFNELYNPDITKNWGNTLCHIEKRHELDSSPDKYIESETDRYHCRKELKKIISEHQKAGYVCFVPDLSVAAQGRNRTITIF